MPEICLGLKRIIGGGTDKDDVQPLCLSYQSGSDDDLSLQKN